MLVLMMAPFAARYFLHDVNLIEKKDAEVTLYNYTYPDLSQTSMAAA